MEQATAKWLGGAVILAALLTLALALHLTPASRAPLLAEEAAETEADAEAEEAAPADTDLNTSADAEASTTESGEGGEKKQAEPLKWDRPRFEDRKEERLKLVRVYMEERQWGLHVKDKDVIEAMRNVPRHLFMRARDSSKAYRDDPCSIGYGQTISQPSLVAHMTELLELKPGEKVLEIGTGSAYQAAILSELTPHVYSIEIVRELAKQAGQRLQKLGYKTIKTKRGDGYYGWEEHGPFDGIIVTAAAGHVPPPLVKQLKPGGKMVVPVGPAHQPQHLVVVNKDKEGRIKTRSVLPVTFVPMTGRVQKGE